MKNKFLKLFIIWMSNPSLGIYLLSLVLCFTLCNTPSFAQNAGIDFQKINDAYKKHSTFSMSLSYKVFTDYHSQTPIQIEKSEVLKQGNNMYSKLGEIETIMLKEHTIILNHESKFLIVNNPGHAQSGNFLPLNMDSVLKRYKTVNFEQLTDQNGKYHIEYEGVEYSAMDIIFDQNTFLLKQMTLYYREAVELTENSTLKNKPRLEIVVEDMNLKPVFETDTFSDKAYITIQDNKIYKTAQYKSYKLIVNKHG